MEEHRPGIELEEGWILVCKNTEGGDKLVPVESPETITRQQQLFGYDHKPCNVWEEVVNVENALYMGSKPKIAESDDAAIEKLRWDYLLLKNAVMAWVTEFEAIRVHLTLLLPVLCF